MSKTRKQSMKYYFLSFRDPDINRNLGVCIVQAPTLRAAIVKAYKKDINPGGEVASFELTESEFIEEGLELDRLYSREEMKEMGYKSLSEGD